MDLNHLENLITPKTKAVLAVHYGGSSCNMERLTKVVSDNNLLLIEDAAQAINSFYNDAWDHLEIYLLFLFMAQKIQHVEKAVY